MLTCFQCHREKQQGKRKEGLSHAGAHIHLITRQEHRMPESVSPEGLHLLHDDSFMRL